LQHWGQKLAKSVPWQIKIAAKIVLSRMPVDYRLWAKLDMFKHGKMASLSYPKKVFSQHRSVAEKFLGSIEGKTILEMGTGDSVASALLASAAGATRCYMLDVGDFTEKDMSFYQTFAQDIGLILPAGCTYSEMLSAIRGIQLTQGLSSWKQVPGGTLDFIWSHSTLEHVRKGEFDQTLKCMYEAMKPGAITSHNIHLKDHLGGALNNLRFSEKLWEADWWANSGFYTNRLRPSELRAAFLSAGFELIDFVVAMYDTLPTPRNAMDRHFRTMSNEDLMATGVSLVARRR
jgi:hypothetical protein